MFLHACRKAAPVALLALFAAAPFAARSREQPWRVRERPVHLESGNKDSTGLGLSVNDRGLPELDLKVDPWMIGAGFGWRS